MVIEQMSDRECRELLARTRMGRLACALRNQPYVVPIDVDYYDGCFYGLSMLGQKVEWMRANPLVCVEMDELTARRDWETVIAFGEYDELTDTPEHAQARSTAESLFRRHPIWWEPATIPLAGRQTHEPVLFRILITRMTGRRARLEDDEVKQMRPTARSRVSRRRSAR
jgi:nitroimidazol reductase NimA-like FMN-containing flavoprotein (pyridoxamine 5'-phosphate oxidase superfamily)